MFPPLYQLVKISSSRLRDAERLAVHFFNFKLKVFGDSGSDRVLRKQIPDDLCWSSPHESCPEVPTRRGRALTYARSAFQ